MRLSPKLALGSLVVIASVAAGSAWLTLRSLEPRKSIGTDSPIASRPPDSSALDADVELDAVHRRVRPEVQAIASDPLEARTAPTLASRELVRVHGQVRRVGRPVADYDLAFLPASGEADGNDEDWDVTDEDGRYEVELPAGSYVVRNDDEGPWVTDVVVPATQGELVVDIHLSGGN